jgi:N-acetylmuramoyl-L-alanine amidase
MMWAAPSLYADDESTFNTVRIEGRNYVNLADFIKFYGFDKNYLKNENTLTLRTKTQKLTLKVNSRECFLNGVRVWLNDAPLENRNSYLISEIDIRKSLDPVLRAWTVRRKRIETIMIDPGHGGEDLGASGYKGSMEKRLTLALSGRVEKLLREAGFRTLMTRRSDTYVSLQDRSDLANSSEADIFISIHFNSAKPNSEPSGIETYCLTPVGLSSTGSIGKRLGIGSFGEEAGNRFDTQNMLLAFLVQQKMQSKITEAEDRGVKRARFFVIKATERPSILIENGFISNPVEERRILSGAYSDRLAEAIVEGIKKFATIMNTPSKKK